LFRHAKAKMDHLRPKKTLMFKSKSVLERIPYNIILTEARNNRPGLAATLSFCQHLEIAAARL
jgi:hypothetical protein